MAGIVLLSDLHFANRSSFGRLDSKAEFTGCNSRFHEIAKIFRSAAKYASENNCEYIFILGDLFHDRGIIDIPVFNGVYQLFNEVIELGLKLVVFPGNHDTVDLRAMHINKHLHSLFTFEKLVNVYDVPSIVQTSYFPIVVVPYSNSGKEIIAATDNLVKKMTGDIKMAMFHHSFNDAITGPHEWVMPHKLDADDLSKKFTHKWSGHYHLYQKLSSNLWYVGAPLQHDFGERKYIPGFIHVLPDGTWKHIENTISPKFQVIKTKDLKDLKDLSLFNYISIKWGGDVREIESIKNTIPENCIIEYDTNQGTTFFTRTTIQTTDAIEDMIMKYVDARSPLVESKDLTDHGVLLYKGSK